MRFYEEIIAQKLGCMLAFEGFMGSCIAILLHLANQAAPQNSGSNPLQFILIVHLVSPCPSAQLGGLVARIWPADPV